MRHSNPYYIRDEKNWLEVTENSSHPELDDAKRIWKFYAYTFTSATEVDKFFSEEGLDRNKYTTESKSVREFHKNMIIINIVPKGTSRNDRGLRSLRG